MSAELLLQNLALGRQDFFTVLAEIYAHGYTGTVLLHCVNGVPKVAEFPSQQVRLTPPSGMPLDKPLTSR